MQLLLLELRISLNQLKHCLACASYRPYALGRTQLTSLYTLTKYLFLEMGWRGKHDFTVLNNCVLRNGNDLITRQKVCELFTYNILQG